MSEPDRCPFCGNTDIRYSLVRSGDYGDIRFHASMWCPICHCYGPKVLSKVVLFNDYEEIRRIKEDEALRQKTIEEWNRRTDNA